MNYFEVGVVNPRTGEQRSVTVELSDDQVAAAKASEDWMLHIQQLAKRPKGFNFLSNAVKAVGNA